MNAALSFPNLLAAVKGNPAAMAELSALVQLVVQLQHEVVELQAKVAGLEAQLRTNRRTSSKLTQLKAQILEVRAQVLLPQSLMAKACDYALNQWEKLEVYAHHGEVETDNNWCENAMRPVALGRKNWLHLGSHESGPMVESIMTVLASAQRLGLNVRDCLGEVLETVCDPVGFNITRIDELLPTRWKPKTSSSLEPGP
jgi:hypothetical protein